MSCPDCGHEHAGVELGQICVGCPCGRRHLVARVVRRNSDGVIWTRAVCSCGFVTGWMFGERNARGLVITHSDFPPAGNSV
jgi:hypothetical protein